MPATGGVIFIQERREKKMSVKITVDINEDQLRKLLAVANFMGGEPFEKTIKDAIDIALKRYEDMFEYSKKKQG